MGQLYGQSYFRVKDVFKLRPVANPFVALQKVDCRFITKLALAQDRLSQIRMAAPRSF